MRHIRINVDLFEAWEVWDAMIPDDIPDEDVEDWVRNNMSDVDLLGVHESGCTSNIVESVDLF